MVTETHPKRLGRYEVRGKIGEGGMATVYLAIDPTVKPDGLPNGASARPSASTQGQASHRHAVALKVIKDVYSMNNEFVTMFTDEAKLASQLSHPNIVSVYELGADGNRLFIAMEFLRGQSLWHVWNACRERGVRLRYDVAAYIGARVAEGLHHAHEAKGPRGESLELVHRDVNASNIFVTYDGQVKIIDFGLAKAANKLGRTRAGMVKGKLAYMSPEQALGRPVDRRTDLFALGISLWECTVDRRLFKGKDDTDTLERVHAAFVPDPRELVDGYPDQLWAVLQRSLERDPQARYSNGLEMAAALDQVATHEGRAVDANVVSGIMHALFRDAIAEQDRWLVEAESVVPQPQGVTPEPLRTMRPGPSAGERLVEMPDVVIGHVGPPSRIPSDVLSSRDFNPAVVDLQSPPTLRHAATSNTQSIASSERRPALAGQRITASMVNVPRPSQPSQADAGQRGPHVASPRSAAPAGGRAPTFQSAPQDPAAEGPRSDGFLPRGAGAFDAGGIVGGADPLRYASRPKAQKTPWATIVIVSVILLGLCALGILAVVRH